MPDPCQECLLRGGAFGNEDGTARSSEKHFPPPPATDLVLALGVYFLFFGLGLHVHEGSVCPAGDFQPAPPGQCGMLCAAAVRAPGQLGRLGQGPGCSSNSVSEADSYSDTVFHVHENVCLPHMAVSPQGQPVCVRLAI